MSKQLHTSEMLILKDGKILVHNLTPPLAQLLSSLDPFDEEMKRRSQAETKPIHTTTSSNHQTGQTH